MAELSWHGTRAWHADWSRMSRTLAFMLRDRRARPSSEDAESIYVAMNMHWEAHGFEVPRLDMGLRWHVSLNTAVAPPGDCWAVGAEPVLAQQDGILVGERSVVVLVGRRAGS